MKVQPVHPDVSQGPGRVPCLPLYLSHDLSMWSLHGFLPGAFTTNPNEGWFLLLNSGSLRGAAHHTTAVSGQTPSLPSIENSHRRTPYFTITSKLCATEARHLDAPLYDHNLPSFLLSSVTSRTFILLWHQEGTLLDPHIGSQSISSFLIKIRSFRSPHMAISNSRFQLATILKSMFSNL